MISEDFKGHNQNDEGSVFVERARSTCDNNGAFHIIIIQRRPLTSPALPAFCRGGKHSQVHFTPARGEFSGSRGAPENNEL